MGAARIAPLIVFAALAVQPASAGAETIRVAKGGGDAPDCGRGANPPCEHIAAALGLTPGAQNGDVISIGPGDYPEIVSTDKNVRFVGAGAGTLDTFDPARHTRLRPPSDASPTLRLAGSGGQLEKLRIEAISGADINVALRIDPPVDLNPKTYALNDVTLSGSGSKQTAMEVFPSGGGRSRAAVPISGSRLSGGGDDNESRAIVFGGDQPLISVTVTDSFLTAVYDAIEPDSDGSLAVQRSTIEAGENGIDGDADITVERSTVRGAQGGLRLAGSPSAQSVLVKSSLVLTDGPTGLSNHLEAPIAVDSAPAGGIGNVNLNVFGSTLIGRGPVDGGLVVNTAAGETAVADLRGSAVAATGTELRTLGSGAESISASKSAFADSAGNAPAPGSGTNVGGDPLIGADFKPLAGSPLIDKGDPALFAAGELDLAGVPRGAAPEIGAFEYVPPAAGGVPPAAGGTNVAPGLSGFAVSNKTFAPMGVRARRRGRKVQRGTSFRYTLSEAARVVITVERKLRGYRSGKRCRSKRPAQGKRRRCTLYRKVGTLSASKGAGRQSTPFSGRFRGKALKPGSYRASIVATDAGGLKSTRRSAGFKVVWP